MYYKINQLQQLELLNLPETGMGYQIVEASKSGSYSRNRYLVLNSEVVVEVNASEDIMMQILFFEHKNTLISRAEIIHLQNMEVINEKQFRNLVTETKNDYDKGALDNPVEPVDGNEIFVRLSAFDDDKRIDKMNKCLRPGSFTTTEVDYRICKMNNDNPVDRYALPNNYEVKFAFHIQPVKTDTLQRGRVQPANGKRGGGIEDYFVVGTTRGTYLKQTDY